jgi:hypothetical protein
MEIKKNQSDATTNIIIKKARVTSVMSVRLARREGRDDIVIIIKKADIDGIERIRRTRNDAIKTRTRKRRKVVEVRRSGAERRAATRRRIRKIRN